MVDGKGTCRVEECTNEIKVIRLQLCDKHYHRFWRHGDVNYSTNEQHGMRYTSEYGIWTDIKKRCRNPSHTGYYNYGGRGIDICNGWCKSFISFYKDIGKRPSKKHSIDRIDNNGNYSCGHCEQCLREGWEMNCRWATIKEQSLNKRTNRLITFEGETLTLSEWEGRIGGCGDVIKARLSYGWSIERALTTPVKKIATRKKK